MLTSGGDAMNEYILYLGGAALYFLSLMSGEISYLIIALAAAAMLVYTGLAL